MLRKGEEELKNNSKEKRNSIRVIDLNAGLGGRAYAFQECGCEVVAAIERDKETCRYLKQLMPSVGIFNENLQVLMPEELPEADIILAKYIQMPISSVGSKQDIQQEDANIAIRKIILNKRPIWKDVKTEWKTIIQGIFNEGNAIE